jgi:hypothetical protein
VEQRWGGLFTGLLLMFMSIFLKDFNPNDVKNLAIQHPFVLTTRA